MIVAAYLLYFKDLSLKSAVVLVVSMLLFSFAASNLHDFLWCGHMTTFYTHAKAGGYDLGVWVEVFGMPNDYRVFGASMTLLMVIFLYLGFKFVNSFLIDFNKKFLIMGIIVLGVFLYFIDMVFITGALQLLELWPHFYQFQYILS